MVATTEPTSAGDSLISCAKVAEMYDVDERTIERWEKCNPPRIPLPVIRRHRFKRWSRNAILADIERIKCGELAEAAS